MKAYCPKCFAKIDYKFSKPKFCSECGSSFNASFSNTVNKSQENSKSEDFDKIKELERQIEKLKVDSSNKSRVINKSNQASDELDDDQYEDDDEFDTYEETRRSIDSFKRSKNKFNGVTIEKTNRNAGISFGELIEAASNGGSYASSEEFKMINEKDPNAKKLSKKEILEQLKQESSSQARIIEVD